MRRASRKSFRDSPAASTVTFPIKIEINKGYQKSRISPNRSFLSQIRRSAGQQGFVSYATVLVACCVYGLYASTSRDDIIMAAKSYRVLYSSD